MNCDKFCQNWERCCPDGTFPVRCEVSDKQVGVSPSLGYTDRVTVAEASVFDAPAWAFEWGCFNEIGGD